MIGADVPEPPPRRQEGGEVRIRRQEGGEVRIRRPPAMRRPPGEGEGEEAGQQEPKQDGAHGPGFSAGPGPRTARPARPDSSAPASGPPGAQDRERARPPPAASRGLAPGPSGDGRDLRRRRSAGAGVSGSRQEALPVPIGLSADRRDASGQDKDPLGRAVRSFRGREKTRRADPSQGSEGFPEPVGTPGGQARRIRPRSGLAGNRAHPFRYRRARSCRRPKPPRRVIPRQPFRA